MFLFFKHNFVNLNNSFKVWHFQIFKKCLKRNRNLIKKAIDVDFQMILSLQYFVM